MRVFKDFPMVFNGNFPSIKSKVFRSDFPGRLKLFTDQVQNTHVEFRVLVRSIFKY